MTKENIKSLNETYQDLSIQERLNQLYTDFSADKILVTSSFATTSVVLLHHVAKANPKQKIHFIDTGYHFKETYQYRDEIANLLGIEVVNVHPEDWKHQFTTKDKTWESDTDFCCSVNKVEPLEKVKESHQIWVSGLMKWQNQHRADLNFFEDRGGIIKFHPLLDLSEKAKDQYIIDHQLPPHPLQEKGYHSIGCEHCTKPGKGREGRWGNSSKTECGLHL